MVTGLLSEAYAKANLQKWMTCKILMCAFNEVSREPREGATFANDYLNKSRMWGVVCIPIWLIGGDADKRSKHRGRAKSSQIQRIYVKDGYHSSHTQMPCLALEIYINYGWCALPESHLVFVAREGKVISSENFYPINHQIPNTAMHQKYCGHCSSALKATLT